MGFDGSRKIWNDKGRFVLPTNQFIEPVIEKGQGSFVWDVDGNKYLDLNCGQFCLCFGHGYSRFLEAVNRQMEKITHTNTNTLSGVVFDALERLIEITDGAFGAGILLATGAEAAEFALRFVKSISKKEKMLFLNEGYHGLSLGTQSVSSSGKWAFPQVTGTFGIAVPRCLAEVDPCLAEIERVVAESRGEIAAFIMEPILGAGGMIFPPVSFLKGVRTICDRSGILLVFDECQTGFGRTGNWFCYQKYGVVPDALVFGKASGAGFPVSGVLFNDKLVDSMRRGSMTHFSSHQNDPLAAAVMMFVMEEIQENKVLAHIDRMGDTLLNRLQETARLWPALVQPRGIGLMTAFDLDEKLFVGERNPGNELTRKLLSRGVIIQSINRGRTCRVMPSFLVSLDEIDYFIENLNGALEEISNE